MKLARTTLFVICTNDLDRAGEIIASRVAPMRPTHSISDDPQADLPPGGTVARGRTGSNAPGR